MKKALHELLSDPTGMLSTMRVDNVAVVAVILSILIAQNVQSMIHNAGFRDLPTNCLAALGLVIVGKVAQNFTEKGTCA
jgi:hypothetical protein